MQSKIYIAATPGPAGTTSALLHIEKQTDVYGWFLESVDLHFSAAFFMLEDFYAHRPAVLYSSVRDDVNGEWRRDQPPALHPIRCPVPENVIHDLEQQKSKLAQDWLVFHDEHHLPNNTDMKVYERHGMAGRAVNIKARKLNRLCCSLLGWQHWSAGFDQNVMDYLLKFRRDEHCIPLN